jgi:hypothetical protein
MLSCLLDAPNKEPISTEIIMVCFCYGTLEADHIWICILPLGILVEHHFIVVLTIALKLIVCEELLYSFSEDLHTAANCFKNISSNNAINGCVALIDVYLLRIKVPSTNEVGNDKYFLSGHYQAYKINI